MPNSVFSKIEGHYWSVLALISSRIIAWKEKHASNYMKNMIPLDNFYVFHKLRVATGEQMSVDTIINKEESFLKLERCSSHCLMTLIELWQIPQKHFLTPWMRKGNMQVLSWGGFSLAKWAPHVPEFWGTQVRGEGIPFCFLTFGSDVQVIPSDKPKEKVVFLKDPQRLLS